MHGSNRDARLDRVQAIPEDKIAYFRARILRWGEEHYRNFPWRDTNNQWHALAAEIMLQRTRAEQVLPVYQTFCRDYEEPSDYATDDDSAVFESLGLHWRRQTLKQLALRLSDRSIPRDIDQLKQFPGVGDYIAAAYLSLHCDKRLPIIDSNVVRLYGRFFGFDTGPESRRSKWVELLAERVTPETGPRAFNYALIDFTREICAPNPLHDQCNIASKCEYYKTTIQETEA